MKSEQPSQSGLLTPPPLPTGVSAREWSELVRGISVANYAIYMILDATTSSFFTEALTVEVQKLLMPFYFLAVVASPIVSATVLVVCWRALAAWDKRSRPTRIHWRWIVAAVMASFLLTFQITIGFSRMLNL